MVTINNTASLPYPNSKSPLAKPYFITSSTSLKFFFKSTPKPFLIRCSSSNNNAPKGRTSNSLKDALTGMVGKEVEDLLSREENRELLDGLVEASDRVERAKRELADIERQQLEADQLKNYVNRLETRAYEIAESQQEILEARAKLEEAERSLTLNTDREGYGDEAQNSSENDRLESIKTASISAIVGTLASLPVSLTQATTITDLLLPSAITFVSCALYGMTFRYAIRRDLNDFHLKSGTIAAFGFVKGLGELAGGPTLELTPASLLSHAIDGAVLVSENLLIFAFAVVSIDFCFRMRLLTPFPAKNTNV